MRIEPITTTDWDGGPLEAHAANLDQGVAYRRIRGASGEWLYFVANLEEVGGDWRPGTTHVRWIPLLGSLGWQSSPGFAEDANEVEYSAGLGRVFRRANGQVWWAEARQARGVWRPAPPYRRPRPAAWRPLDPPAWSELPALAA